MISLGPRSGLDFGCVTAAWLRRRPRHRSDVPAASTAARDRQRTSPPAINRPYLATGPRGARDIAGAAVGAAAQAAARVEARAAASAAVRSAARAAVRATMSVAVRLLELVLVDRARYLSRPSGLDFRWCHSRPART